MAARRDPLGDWVAKHDDKWLSEHSRDAGGALAALAIVGGGLAGAWWIYTYQAGLLLWARTHTLGLGIVAALVLAAAVEIFFTIRNRPKYGKITKEWPALAKGFGFEGAKLVSRSRDRDGETLKIQLNRFAGQTVEGMVAKVPAIEVAAKARKGRVRVIPDESRADLCAIRLDKHDPLAKSIRWPGSAMTSCTQPMVLGKFGDGKPVKVDWNGRHILIGGITDSGKSNAINVAFANLAPCRDLAILGIDLKGGMELGPWRGAISDLAVTADQALALLERAVAIMDERELRYGSQTIRKHAPTRAEPRILVVIDELSQLKDDRAMALVLRIAQQGRAAGVQLLLATQQPSAKQLATKDASGTALRGQIYIRICMAVSEGREVGMILGDEYRKDGFLADRVLLQKGSFFIVSRPQHALPRPARTFEMTDADVAKAVETADLASISGETESHAESHENLTDDARLLAILADAGEAGVLARDVISVFGKSKATVHRDLRRLREAGLVESDKAGRWRRVSESRP